MIMLSVRRTEWIEAYRDMWINRMRMAFSTLLILEAERFWRGSGDHRLRVLTMREVMPGRSLLNVAQLLRTAESTSTFLENGKDGIDDGRITHWLESTMVITVCSSLCPSASRVATEING